MYETPEHQAFRKKLESLIEKYEPQFPVVNHIHSVAYGNYNWDVPSLGYVSSDWNSFITSGRPKRTFLSVGLVAPRDASTEFFNFQVTRLFVTAYLNHLQLANDRGLRRSLKIEYGREHSVTSTPTLGFDQTVWLQLPDLSQSWIKYFEQLKDKLDELFAFLSLPGGAYAVED